MLDLSASHPVRPVMLGAGSPGTSNLHLMLQTPSHFNGPWFWYLLKYLYLKETTLKAEQVWPWSTTYLLRYYLLVADLLPAHIARSVTPGLTFSYPPPKFSGSQLPAASESWPEAAVMPWTFPYSTKATYGLLPVFFRFCFQLSKVKATYMVQCRVWVDSKWSVTWRGTSSLPTLCRWKKCPLCVALLKEVMRMVTFKGKHMRFKGKPVRLGKREKSKEYAWPIMKGNSVIYDPK